MLEKALRIMGSPQQRLGILAAIARRAVGPDFQDRWTKAKDGEHLKRVLLDPPSG